MESLKKEFIIKIHIFSPIDASYCEEEEIWTTNHLRTRPSKLRRLLHDPRCFKHKDIAMSDKRTNWKQISILRIRERTQ